MTIDHDDNIIIYYNYTTFFNLPDTKNIIPQYLTDHKQLLIITQNINWELRIGQVYDFMNMVNNGL